MNPDAPKFRQQQQQSQETELGLHSVHKNSKGLEFGSVEEVIRFDARQTEVPPQIAERLNDSVSREPQPARSWWRRLFFG